MNKEKSLAQINKIMCQNNLSIKEVIDYVLGQTKSKKTAKASLSADEFDLLCIVDGKNVRLPFNVGRYLSPIAIFPFKNESNYIEFDETENKRHIDDDVDDTRLLDERFCKRVFEIKERLNRSLRILKKPILHGEYLADSVYMYQCGWIVDFNHKSGQFASDYHGGSELAKLRYGGQFKNL